MASKSPTDRAALRDWEDLVMAHFGYLTERYGMKIITKQHGAWETAVTFAQGGVAVVVRSSVEFNRAEVELIRLVDGNVPPVPIFIHPETSIDRSILDNLLELRSASDLATLGKLDGLDRGSLDRSLAFQATALEKYAGDFLRGDTAIFEELDRLIKARVAANPQRITISFPEGTSPEEVEQGIADAKRVDPRVPVDVRFYRRPTH